MRTLRCSAKPTHTAARVACIVLGLTLTVSGCATNPYVLKPRPHSIDVGLTPQMQSALANARSLSDQYKQKLSSEFTRQQFVSNGLLTLAAGGLAAAAFGAHRDVLIGAGILGALGYQLGTWNTSSSRDAAFGYGIEALACAEAAIAPLRLPEAHLTDLRTDADKVLAMTKVAAQRAGDVMHRRLAGGVSQAADQAAQTELAQAAAVLDRAANAYGKARAVESKVRGAGAFLDARVAEIDSAVTKAATDSRAQLSELPKQISALARYSTLIVPEASAVTALASAAGGATTRGRATAQSGGPGAASEVRNADDRLGEAVGELYAARTALATAVKGLEDSAAPAAMNEETKSALAKCAVDPAAIAGSLTLAPPTAKLEAKAGARTQIKISGGTLSYTATLVDGRANAIQLDQPSGSTFYVFAEDTTAPGTYTVRVDDASKQSVVLTVTVTAKDAAGASSGGSSSGGSGTPTAQSGRGAVMACTGFQSRSRAAVCLVQHVTGSKVDGTFGNGTCTALRNGWHSALKFPVSRPFEGNFNDDTMAAVNRAVGLPANADDAAIAEKVRALGLRTCRGVAFADAAPVNTAVIAAPAATSTASSECAPVADATRCLVRGAECAFECDYTPKELSNVRRRLNLAATPAEFDKPLRDGIGKFQVDRKLQTQNRTLTPETAAEIQKLPLPR